MADASRSARPWRFLGWVAGAVILAPLLYLASALVLGAIPMNRAWRSGDEGVTVWLTTNGVHAGIAMPARNATMDWTRLYPPIHNAHPNDARAEDVVTIGWGDRHFFLDVPQWSDLSVRTALTAIGGRDTAALHVEYGPAPANDASAVRLVLAPDAYARLVAFVAASTPTGADGAALWIPGHHYAMGDAFYEANGRYSLFVTCNQWTRDALAAAGVRVPLWSPFDKALFWHLP